MNIALLSPSRNSYSETFIQAQKKYLKGDVFYYYDGLLPTKLEGHGSILRKNLWFLGKLRLLKNDYRVHSFSSSLKKNKIDVILAHYGPTGESVAEISRSLKIPLIVHFHGYDASMINVINSNNSYKLVFDIAKYVIVVSKEMKSRLVQLGCPTSKIIYNPCAPEDFFAEITPRFSKRQFIAVGRFTDKKAPYITILAFKNILNTFPDAKLLIAGDGPLLNACVNLVECFRISENVKFLGVITPSLFKKILEESMAFVQHSITANNGDMEGTPVAILEASAAGLPIISTYHAGIPDVVLDKETGLLVNEKDINGMSRAMMKVLEFPKLAIDLGIQGKKRIKKYYSMSIHIGKLNEIIRSTI
ncbi:glycosyltransferase [Hanstruepera marina]|uniref:glycosyltransferase n=1 Tax=Hanstruepera marina TaxID=2873265 RepID=UPI001CA71BFE|nr:glycosyltransferase [Hanstruepera marina]